MRRPGQARSDSESSAIAVERTIRMEGADADRMSKTSSLWRGAVRGASRTLRARKRPFVAAVTSDALSTGCTPLQAICMRAGPTARPSSRARGRMLVTLTKHEHGTMREVDVAHPSGVRALLSYQMKTTRLCWGSSHICGRLVLDLRRDEVVMVGPKEQSELITE